MSNSNKPYNPTFKAPTPSLCPLKPVTEPATLTPEMQELDNCPVAAVTPESNKADGTGKLVKDGASDGAGRTFQAEPAKQDEFNLFPDGTLMKWMDRPGFEPQCALFDGKGRQFGVVRNPAVADLICNGVNYLHLAAVTHAAEMSAVARGESEKVEGKVPPLLITPNFTGPVGIAGKPGIEGKPGGIGDRGAVGPNN